MTHELNAEVFHVNPDDVIDEWNRDDLAKAIYAGAVARVAPALGSDGMATDRAFLQALVSLAKFAAAVYCEADDGKQAET
jgi:hypothetical protein